MRQIPLDQWGRETARVFQSPGAAPRDPRAFVQDSGEAMGRALSQSGQALQDTAAQLEIQRQREAERQRVEAERQAAEEARQRQISESIQAKRDELEAEEKLVEQTRTIAARTDLNAEQKRQEFDKQFASISGQYRGRYVDPQVSGGMEVGLASLRLRNRDALERGITAQAQSQNEANILSSLDLITRRSVGAPEQGVAEMEKIVRTSGAAAGWDAAKIESVVQNQRAAMFATSAAADVEADPARALEQLRGDGYQYLDPDKRLQLVGVAQAELDRRQAQAERQAMARLTMADRAVNNLAAIYDAGGIPTPALIAEAETMARGTPAQASMDALLSTVADRARFASRPLAEQAAEVEQLQQQAQDPAVGVDRAGVSALQWKARAYDATAKAVQDDPLGAAVQRGLVEVDPLDLTNVQALGEGLQDRMRKAAEVEAWAGRPVPPMTRAEIDAVAAQLKAGTPQAQEFYLKALAAGIDEPQAYLATLRTMAPKAPELATAGYLLNLSDTGSRRTAELLLEGTQHLRTPEGQAKRLTMPKDIDFLETFESATEGAYGGNAQLRAHDFDNAKLIYAALSVRAGAYVQDEVDDARAREAILLATGGVDDYNDVNVILPRGMDVDEFGRRVRAELRALRESGALGTAVSQARLDRLPVQLATRNGLQGYTVVDGGQALVDVNGLPVFIDMADGGVQSAPTQRGVPGPDGASFMAFP